MSDEKGNEGKTLAPRQEARKLPPREVPGPVWRTTAARRGLEWALRLTLAAALAAGRIPGEAVPLASPWWPPAAPVRGALPPCWALWADTY